MIVATAVPSYSTDTVNNKRLTIAAVVLQFLFLGNSHVRAVERHPLALVCQVSPVIPSVMTEPITLSISFEWARRGLTALQGRSPLPLIESELDSFAGLVSIHGERPRVVFLQELDAAVTGVSFDGLYPETYTINFDQPSGYRIEFFRSN